MILASRTLAHLQNRTTCPTIREADPQPKFCKRANFSTLDRNVENNLK
jgi:hypothetical protein